MQPARTRNVLIQSNYFISQARVFMQDTYILKMLSCQFIFLHVHPGLITKASANLFLALLFQHPCCVLPSAASNRIIVLNQGNKTKTNINVYKS